MKRKLLYLLLTIIMLFSACGSTEANNSNITNEIEETKEEIKQETEEQTPEPEPEETEEPTPEPDKPLDIESKEELKSLMTILAGVGNNTATREYDYNLTFINELYAMEKMQSLPLYAI